MDIEFCDSSDDEIILPLLSPVKIPEVVYVDNMDDDDDVEEIISVMHPVINGIQKINRFIITNYLQIVTNYSDKDFLMHFRLNRCTANQLIHSLEISCIYTSLKDAGQISLTPEKHMLTFLWFVGHQSSSYREVADRFGITLSTLFVVITRVADFLISIAPTVIKYPNHNEKEQTAEFFLITNKFPKVIGAIDGAHVRINRPEVDPDLYINKKKYYSIQVQGLVNEKKKIVDVFIGYPGSVHEARVFRESELFQSLPDVCSGDYYMLADSAYPLRKEVMVPYKDNGHLTRNQKEFNKRLNACRVVVQHVFGEIKQRFQQLYLLKLRKIERIVNVIYACCVLHNLANSDDLSMFENSFEGDSVLQDTENEDDEQNIEVVYNDHYA